MSYEQWAPINANITVCFDEANVIGIKDKNISVIYIL